MTNPIGRPMKYRTYLEVLEDEEVYSPSTIVTNGISKGLLDTRLKGKALKLEKLKIRHALARYSANHFFPKMGDGYIDDIPGQAPIRGWLGKRWKEDLD